MSGLSPTGPTRMRTVSPPQSEAVATLSSPTDNQPSTSRSSDDIPAREYNTGISGGRADRSNVVGKVEEGAQVNMTVRYGATLSSEDIKQRTLARIQEWTRDMVETAAFAELMDKLNRGATWVTIKGQPGEGKSTAAYMALGKLHQSGREVFKVNTPEEFTEVTATCLTPDIMLDDILGNLEFDQMEWTKWKPAIIDILEEREHLVHGNTSKKKEVTIILVSRNYVLDNVVSDLGKVATYFRDNKHVVFISKSGVRTIEEKVAILKAICKSKDFDLDEEIKETICHARGPHGFPHTCRLFVTLRKDGVEIDAERFMEAPLEFLNQTVQKFIEDETKQLLFKEMLKRDGKITIRELQSFKNKLVVIKLVDSLLDSYLRKEDDCYYFHHPSIYDSVSFNLLKYDTVFVIECCSLSFLHERLRLDQSSDTCHESSLVVNIPRCFIVDLAKRFAAEIENRNLRLVLSHKALTDQLFIEELMSCVQLPLTQLLTLTDKQIDIDDDFLDEEMDEVFQDEGMDEDFLDEERYRSFLSLVASNKSPKLLKYIDNQTDIQLTERDIHTVLYGVCKYAASDVLTYLVQSRDTLDINVRYQNGKTPLMIASKTRDDQFVQQIMSLGSNLNAKGRWGLTVLHYSCINGHVRAVEEVIDRVGGVDVKDWLFRSPLWYAYWYNQMDVARVLIDRGARVDAQTVVEACRGGNLDLVKLLWEGGATVNMTADMYTPLTVASAGGHVKVMRFLFDKGASVNTVDRSGLSPLYWACIYNNPQAVQCLLEHGAYIDSRSLDIAVRKGYKECTDLLQK